MGTILNLSKLAQVKMKFTSAILIGISASPARADWGPGGGFGGYGNGGDWGNNWGWGGAPDCAKTCFSSIFPAQSTAWSSACASQTIIDNCVTSACPTATAEYASASSVRSEWCSSYSSCSTASDSHFHKRCSSSNERCWSLGSCSFGCLYGPLRGSHVEYLASKLHLCMAMHSK